jgi:hypothetical protein
VKRMRPYKSKLPSTTITPMSSILFEFPLFPPYFPFPPIEDFSIM